MPRTRARPAVPGGQFISTDLDLLETETATVGDIARIHLQRAAIPGPIAGVLHATSLGLVAAFDAIAAGVGETRRQPGRVLGAVAFGWTLVFLSCTRSARLTSSMTIVSIDAHLA